MNVRTKKRSTLPLLQWWWWLWIIRPQKDNLWKSVCTTTCFRIYFFLLNTLFDVSDSLLVFMFKFSFAWFWFQFGFLLFFFLTTMIYYSPKYRFPVHSKLFSICFSSVLRLLITWRKSRFFLHFCGSVFCFVLDGGVFHGWFHRFFLCQRESLALLLLLLYFVSNSHWASLIRVSPMRYCLRYTVILRYCFLSCSFMLVCVVVLVWLVSET